MPDAMEEEDLVCWRDEEHTIAKIRLCTCMRRLGRGREEVMGWKGVYLELGFATTGTLGGFLSGLWSAGVLIFLLAVPDMVLSLLCVVGMASECTRSCARGAREVEYAEQSAYTTLCLGSILLTRERGRES